MMDKRIRILKSGLTVRELLRLKNNYVYVKSDDFKFNTSTKKAESFADYIFIVARLCWEAMYLPAFISLFFSIYAYYYGGNMTASIKVFSIIFPMAIFLKVKSDYYNIRMVTVLKLIRFRLVVL